MRRRALFLYILLGAVFSGLLAGLYRIAVDKTSTVAASQSSRSLTVATSRGTIYDADMIPLVNAETEYRAALGPDENLLSHIRGSTDPDAYKWLCDQLAEGSPASVKLLSPVGPMQGMKLYSVPVRYGERLPAPHLIGYLDDSGQHGVTGIEKACDTVLNRYSGKATAVFTVDGKGRCLLGVDPDSSNTTGRSAGGVCLTIRSDIQKAVEDISPQYMTKGAVVMMDPYSGEILAMASFPSFQPDRIASAVKSEDGALINRALSLFDCGSVFKIVTASAALEYGVLPPQVFSCSGAINVNGTVFHCHNRLGHGSLDMMQAFAKSCNVYFIRLAEQIGGGTLFGKATDLGFGRAITLAPGLAAPASLLPDAETVRNNPAALANFSFGQGYLMATPLHICQMTAAIANGGTLPQTHIIRGYANENGQFTAEKIGNGYSVLNAETAETVQSMMREVVLTGTGRQAQGKSVQVAGKTGTAETGQSGGDKPVVQSWFSGFFPADDPLYVITVLAEDSQNTDGKTAALVSALADAVMAIREEK